MEIRNGYGIGGGRVTGPVRVGDPLTLMIYMRSKYDGFDIVVNDCYAHNGANKRIQLIDEFGWVLWTMAMHIEYGMDSWFSSSSSLLRFYSDVRLTIS